MKLLVSGLVAAADKRHVRVEHSTSFTCLHIDVSPTRTVQPASVLHSAHVIEMYLKASGNKFYIPPSRTGTRATKSILTTSSLRTTPSLDGIVRVDSARDHHAVH